MIADDHEIVRSALQAALTDPAKVDDYAIEIVDTVENGLDAIAAVKQHRPDLLLLDVSMPLAGGVEVVVEAKRWSADTRIVVFTGISMVGKIAELVDVGVEGLFSKADPNEVLYAQIPTILEGGRHVCDSFAALLEADSERETLTNRERQILNLIIGGQSNKEIAVHLGISAKTVDRHRTNLMQKLGVHSVAQLIAYALREGLIDPASEV